MGIFGGRGKWKVTKGESMRSRLLRPSRMSKFSAFEKAIVLCMVLFVGSLAFGFGYYQAVVFPTYPTVCPSGYAYSNAKCSNGVDPFTTIWNGQVNGKNNTHAPVANDFADLPEQVAQNGKNVSSSVIAFQAGEVIFVSIHGLAAHGCTASVNDNANQNWTGVAAIGCSSASPVRIFWARSSVTQNVNVTVAIRPNTSNPCPGSIDCFEWAAFGFSNVAGVGTTTTFVSDNNICGGPCSKTLDVPSTDFFGSGDAVFADLAVVSTSNNNCSASVTLTGTEFGDFCSAMNTSSQHSDASFSGIHEVNATWNYESGAGSAAFAIVHLVGGIGPCADGYQCFNSFVNPAGDIVMAPGSSFPAVALTDSAVTIANCASKACSFSFAGINTAGYQMQEGQTVAWFMTLNGTLPTAAGFNPLTDPSVALIVYEVKAGPGDNSNFYAVFQRQKGQASFTGILPVPSKCTFASTLFVCGRAAVPTNGNSNEMALTLNYTGGTNPNSPDYTGTSYGCFGSINFGSTDCNLGGFGSTTITFKAQVFNQTLLPWFGVQDGYHVGFYEGPNNPSFTFLTHPIGNNPIISIYTSPATPAPATQDTGGYFGWVGRSLGGAWNAVTGVVGQIAAPVFGLGNSMMSVVIAGFVQALTLYMEAFRIIFNAIGNLLGIGNLGDTIVSFMNFVATLIINTAIVIYDFFAAVVSLFFNGYVAFIVGIVSLFPTLVLIALFVWNLVFGVNFTIDDIAFVMFAYLIFETVEHGLKGFFSTLMLYWFLLSFPFDAAWAIYDRATRAPHRTKQTVDPVG